MSEPRETLQPVAGLRAGDADDQISLTVRSDGAGRTVMQVGGEIDMLTSPQFRTAVLQQLDPAAGIELLVLELDGVTFLGTSGLAVLVEARAAAHTAGIMLRLACAARRVLRPLTVAGLLPLFDVHDSVGSALAST